MPYAAHFKASDLSKVTRGDLFTITIDSHTCLAILLDKDIPQQVFGLLNHPTAPFTHIGRRGMKAPCLTYGSRWNLTPGQPLENGSGVIGNKGNVTLENGNCLLNFDRHPSDEREGTDVRHFDIDALKIADGVSNEAFVCAQWEIWLPEDKTLGLERQSLLTFPLPEQKKPRPAITPGGAFNRRTPCASQIKAEFPALFGATSGSRYGRRPPV